MLSAVQPLPPPFWRAHRRGSVGVTHARRSGGRGSESIPDGRDSLARPKPHLVVGDPYDTEASLREVGVAPTIGLTVELGGVVNDTVDLDHEPAIRVGKVDTTHPPFATGIELADGLGKATSSQQPEESGFQPLSGAT